MTNKNISLLIINAGSSSIKIALYKAKEDPSLLLSGSIKNIGLASSAFVIKQNKTEQKIEADVNNFHTATISLLEWLEKQNWFTTVKAIGHRVVHGMHHTKSEIITDELLNELNGIADYDPEHLPAEVSIIKAIKDKHPALMQVACFDTAFHTTIPAVAKTFAIPKKYIDKGIERYGFHGISYRYLLEKLKQKDENVVKGKIMLAHLGNGASMAAVNNGKCIDTSMGFTPAAGITMSTRSGDIDPGVAWFLMKEGINEKRFNKLINHESGLLGISNKSEDMQELLKLEKDDKNAALAIDIFCYQVKKYFGAYVAALNGCDALVFSGGIGENAAEIRKRVCEDLGYFNLYIDEEKNKKNEYEISSAESKIKIYVIPTNEELMIARDTMQFCK